MAFLARRDAAAAVFLEGGRDMSDNPIATYLNDHLAGSAVALELLEHQQRGRVEALRLKAARKALIPGP